MPATKNNASALGPVLSLRAAQRFIVYWLPVIIYAILIFCVSSIPGQDIPSLFPYQDTLFHIIEYAVFALLINRAVKAYYPSMERKRRLFLVFLMPFAYAVSDELHQSFVPDRTLSFYDFVCDSLGIFIAHVLYR